MASATELNLASPTTNLSMDSPSSPLYDANQTTSLIIDGLGSTEWARLLRVELQHLKDGGSLNPKCLSAPRRRHADPASAALAVIRYEKEIPALRKAILAQEKAKEEVRLHDRLHPPWKARLKAQGQWDELNDPLSIAGAPALPMPVEISDEESLAPFFARIGGGGTFEAEDVEVGEEEYYAVRMKKWVLGPLNISNLMAGLEKNTFIRHFLLGNNMIGPIGARSIAEYVQKWPDNIETWYLAGNCIDLAGLDRLVSAWTKSKAITNIWLKRNPLGPKAYKALFQLIIQTPNLRTLDLDQTELSDEGVAQLFSLLANHKTELPLRNIYLNAVGISSCGCEAIGPFLSSPHCKLESLYMSCNPIGEYGAQRLAWGLSRNSSLLRLSMTSCGLKPKGAEAILRELEAHSGLMTLNMGQSFATNDLGARYNWLNDAVADSVRGLIVTCPSLKLLDLGTTAMTLPTLAILANIVPESKILVFFCAKSVYGRVYKESKTSAKNHIRANVERIYGTTAAQFLADEKRWLISPKDVRMIDSGYRNYDAGLARRGTLQLKKQWEDGMETVNNVMHADDARLEA